MLVALDPGLFCVGPQTTSAELQSRIDHANAAIFALEKRGNARVVRRVGTTNVWNQLYTHCVRPLAPLLTPQLNRSLDRLRGFAECGRDLPEPRGAGRCHGARLMFTHSSLPALAEGWVGLMERVLFAGALAREPLYIVVAQILGRNIEARAADGVELNEVTRFRLYVATKGAPPRAVDCVARARHVDVPWSARLDFRLPDATRDRARCPFCPPVGWERFATSVWRTRESRPCWVDAHGNAWARPRIPGAHHWDVYLTQPGLVERIGLDQLNIVDFGAPATEGKAGSLHHVPAAKRSRLLDPNPSWPC
jgi:hypothetical protein